MSLNGSILQLLLIHSSMTEFVGGFRWNDDDAAARHGAGISRPRVGKPTRLYKLRVMESTKPVLVVTLPAENKRAAIKYAQNRWPAAVVEAA